MIDVHRHNATGTYSVSLRVDDFIDRHIHLQTTDEVEAKQAAKHITAMAAAHWFGTRFDPPELEWFDSLSPVVRRRVARAGVCDLPQNETDEGEGVALSALLDKADELQHDDANHKRTRNSAYKNLRRCFDIERDVFTFGLDDVATFWRFLSTHTNVTAAGALARVFVVASLFNIALRDNLLRSNPFTTPGRFSEQDTTPPPIGLNWKPRKKDTFETNEVSA